MIVKNPLIESNHFLKGHTMEKQTDQQRVEWMCTKISRAHGVARVQQHLDDGRFMENDRPIVRRWLRRQNFVRALPTLLAMGASVVGIVTGLVSCVRG